MTAWHRISPETFAAPPSAGHAADVVEALREVVRSENLLLLRFLVLSDPGVSTVAVEALTEAQRVSPGVVAHLFGRPWTGAWLARCARRLNGVTREEHPLQVDLSHLGAVAAVAASRAGLDVEAETAVRRGLVTLPGLGSVPVEAPELSPVRIAVRGGSISLTTVDDKMTVPEDREETGRWLPVHRLHADCDGRQLTVDLDDLDPFRDCYGHVVTGRTGPAELDRWQVLFDEAWRLLVRHVPWRADEVAAGISSFVPLTRLDAGPVLSATSRDAFGGFGVTRPEDPVVLAATLVHELQHSKLYGLLRGVPLYDAAGSGLYYAPWREDPRPLRGLVQGTYAFLGVADVLGQLRSVPGAGAALTQQFADVAEQLAHTMGTLEACGRLNPAGTLVLAGMRSTLDGLLATPLPAGTVRRAQATLRHNRDLWRAENPGVVPQGL